jgi:hypothetical protein
MDTPLPVGYLEGVGGGEPGHKRVARHGRADTEGVPPHHPAAHSPARAWRERC